MRTYRKYRSGVRRFPGADWSIYPPGDDCGTVIGWRLRIPACPALVCPLALMTSFHATHCCGFSASGSGAGSKIDRVHPVTAGKKGGPHRDGNRKSEQEISESFCHVRDPRPGGHRVHETIRMMDNSWLAASRDLRLDLGLRLLSGHRGN